MMKRFSELGIHYLGILSLGKLIFHFRVILCKPNKTLFWLLWKLCLIRLKHRRPTKSGSQQVQCAQSSLPCYNQFVNLSRDPNWVIQQNWAQKCPILESLDGNFARGHQNGARPQARPNLVTRRVFFLESTMCYNMLLCCIRAFAFVQSNMRNNEQILEWDFMVAI